MKAIFFYFSILIFVSFFNSIQSFGQDVYEMTVSKDGKGDFHTIQSAIDASKAFPDRRITIHIMNGTYHEKVVVAACNNMLSLIGESAEKTIISYDDYFGKINRGRNSTFYTYTFLVEADDFYAENISFENTAGPVGQGVALHVEGDRCMFHNCRILGNQDTLYAGGLKSNQYYKECYIEGTTDFIFGASAALFENCIIYSKSDSYITAASTPSDRSYGFVFIKCKLIAGEAVGKVYLGRPWRDYAKVVFINCELGSHILPEGWSNWSGTARDKTAFFAEFENTGPGAGFSKRVNWSHQLTKEQVVNYVKAKILQPEISPENTVDGWTNENK
jgi:pectinesterase